MKKIATLSIALICFIGTVQAQVLYQRSITVGSMNWMEGAIEWSPVDQTYLLALAGTNNSVLLSKMDATGVPIWTKEFYFPQSDSAAAFGFSMAVAPTGTIYISGLSSNNEPIPVVSYFILSVDMWGGQQWARNYITTSTFPYALNKLQVLPDGSLMLTESVYGSVAYFKTDAWGVVIEANAYREDTTAENKTPGFASAVFPDGSMSFTGKRGSDILIIHTNATGQIQWTRTMNSGASYYHTKSIVALSDGSSIICGYENSYPFLMRLDNAGNTLWYQSFDNGYGTFYEVQQLDASTFIACGDNGYSPVLTKFDINGNLLQSIAVYDGLNYYTSSRMCINPAGTIAWPMSNWNSVSVSYNQSIMIMSDFTTAGCSLDTTTFSSISASTPPATVSMPIYRVPNPITVVGLAVTSQLVPVVFNDFCSLITVSEPEPEPSGMALQNSLVDGESPLSFMMNSYSGEISITITDLSGRMVLNQQQFCTEAELIQLTATKDLSGGMYVLTVTAGAESFTEKFVVR